MGCYRGALVVAGARSQRPVSRPSTSAGKSRSEPRRALDDISEGDESPRERWGGLIPERPHRGQVLVGSSAPIGERHAERPQSPPGQILAGPYCALPSHGRPRIGQPRVPIDPALDGPGWRRPTPEPHGPPVRGRSDPGHGSHHGVGSPAACRVSCPRLVRATWIIVTSPASPFATLRAIRRRLA